MIAGLAVRFGTGPESGGLERAADRAEGIHPPSLPGGPARCQAGLARRSMRRVDEKSDLRRRPYAGRIRGMRPIRGPSRSAIDPPPIFTRTSRATHGGDTRYLYNNADSPDIMSCRSSFGIQGLPVIAAGGGRTAAPTTRTGETDPHPAQGRRPAQGPPTRPDTAALTHPLP